MDVKPPASRGLSNTQKETTINRQYQTAKRELKKQNRIAAGLISELYPQVAGMVIHMTYSQKISNPLRMERTINIQPESYAYFNMECVIKSCDGGGFDFTPVIASMVKKRQNTVKGTMDCKGDVGVDETGHAFVAYEINIEYKKKTK